VTGEIDMQPVEASQVAGKTTVKCGRNSAVPRKGLLLYSNHAVSTIAAASLWSKAVEIAISGSPRVGSMDDDLMKAASGQPGDPGWPGLALCQPAQSQVTRSSGGTRQFMDVKEARY
jgi:hypothetical protein